MEIWDVYDRYRMLTGKRILRNHEEDLEPEEYTLAVHVAIFNSEGEMLIQKRQSTKDKYPDYWDISAGGHSIAGETSEDAMTRELFEELGIQYDFSKSRAVFTNNYLKGFDDLYVITDFDIDLTKLRLQYEEVSNVAWASKEEIKILADDNKFVDYTDGIIDMLFYKNDVNRGVVKRR